MAWLNGIWFENELVNPPGKGEINFENGYKAERLAGQHMPPDGWYWLSVNFHTQEQTVKYGPRVEWWLVECRGLLNGLSQLRSISHLTGGKLNLDWYDFTQAHWVGPVDMPTPPSECPNTGANRL